jgi:hypothetical protein
MTVLCLWERTPSSFGNAFTLHLACKLLNTVHCPLMSSDWTGRVGVIYQIESLTSVSEKCHILSRN